MMTHSEKAPLRFLHLSEFGIAAGVIFLLGGLWTLLVGPEQFLLASAILIALGLAITFVACYYRGCGNTACTPRDW
jgi:hypothetical protein